MATKTGDVSPSTSASPPRKLDESGAAAAAAANKACSPLKPLEELTDADIMQLTREDCRRYLKERGMRRPSWNKAEAIQQVLLLKGLFGSPSPKVPAEDKIKSIKTPSGGAALGVAPSSTDQQTNKLPVAVQQRALGGPLRPPGGQLTIFYSGVVNVFDDVSSETARAIMLLAAGEGEQRYRRPSEPQQRQEDSSESCLPQARTASLHRFLAKRRERKLSAKSRKKQVPSMSGSSDNSSSETKLGTSFRGLYFGSNDATAISSPSSMQAVTAL